MKEEPKVLKRTVIPIEFIDSSNINAAFNFHKPYGAPITPANIATYLKKVKISYKNETDKMDDMKRFRQIKSYDITVTSNKYPDSRFHADVGFDVKRKERWENFFSLKLGKQGGELKLLDCYAEMGEKVVEKRAQSLTFNQKLKIQESMLDNRMRRELTEREAMEMLDDDTDFYQR